MIHQITVTEWAAARTHKSDKIIRLADDSCFITEAENGQKTVYLAWGSYNTSKELFTPFDDACFKCHDVEHFVALDDSAASHLALALIQTHAYGRNAGRREMATDIADKLRDGFKVSKRSDGVYLRKAFEDRPTTVIHLG